MTRRGLFATLMAPLVARFAPKRKATALMDVVNAGINTAWDGTVPFTSAELDAAYAQAMAGNVIWECSQPIGSRAVHVGDGMRTLDQLRTAYNAARSGAVSPDLYPCVPEEDDDFACL
jgi:hypothetical protein